MLLLFFGGGGLVAPPLVGPGNIKKSGTTGKVLKDSATGKLKRCNCCAGQCVCCTAAQTNDCCVAPVNAPCGGGGQPACSLRYPMTWSVAGSLFANRVTSPDTLPSRTDTFSLGGTNAGVPGSICNNILNEVLVAATSTVVGHRIRLLYRSYGNTFDEGLDCDYGANGAFFTDGGSPHNRWVDVLGHVSSSTGDDTSQVFFCLYVNTDGELNYGVSVNSQAQDETNTITASASCVFVSCALQSITIQVSGTGKNSTNNHTTTLNCTWHAQFDGISGSLCTAGYEGEVPDPTE